MLGMFVAGLSVLLTGKRCALKKETFNHAKPSRYLVLFHAVWINFRDWVIGRDPRCAPGDALYGRRAFAFFASLAFTFFIIMMYHDQSKTTTELFIEGVNSLASSNVTWPTNGTQVLQSIFNVISDYRTVHFWFYVVAWICIQLSFFFALFNYRWTFQLSRALSLLGGFCIAIGVSFVAFFNYKAAFPFGIIFPPCTPELDNCLYGIGGDTIGLLVGQILQAETFPILFSLPLWFVRSGYDLLERTHVGSNQEKFLYGLVMTSSFTMPLLFTLSPWISVQQYVSSPIAMGLMAAWYILPTLVPLLTWPNYRHKYKIWLVLYCGLFLAAIMYVIEIQGELEKIWQFIRTPSFFAGAFSEFLVSYVVVSDVFYICFEKDEEERRRQQPQQKGYLAINDGDAPSDDVIDNGDNESEEGSGVGMMTMN